MSTAASDEQDVASHSQPWLQAQGSRHFLDWMAEMQVRLGFTTYQTVKLFFVGRKLDHTLSVFERTFNHCMGLWASPDAQTLWRKSAIDQRILTSSRIHSTPPQMVAA